MAVALEEPRAAALEAVETQVAEQAAEEPIQPTDADGHILMVTEGIIWCSLCGKYNDTRAHRLKEHCLKKPWPGTGYRLKRLMEGRHPISRRLLSGLAQRLTL